VGGDPTVVSWLTRRELIGALRGAVPSLEATAAERRATWERQARLAPPLMIGEIPPMLARFLREAELSIRGANSSAGADIIGIPASPGRATGPARVVRNLDEAARVKSGDVLVCPLTAPAWTSLFGRIAAIVVSALLSCLPSGNTYQLFHAQDRQNHQL
jgi:hypothetical protein